MKQATLIIHDEVNIKIEGLDVNCRKKLVNTFKYDIPHARYLPAVRLGRWDGKAAFFQLGGSTYLNLLPEIIPILEEYDYDVELDDRREYQTTFSFATFTEATFKHKVWPKGHPAAGQPILLRDYQVEIVNNFLSNPQCIQEIATGAGKCLSGETEIVIGIDQATPFGKFLINKLQQEQVNDVTRDYQKI
jgi:hypothetical protein